MNKQELIEYCKSLKGDLNKFINGIDVNKIIAKIEQLDEPQKPVVPQFVAEWIEYCKCNNFTLLGCIDTIRTKHTRKELEEAGFSEVFNNPLFEVEEVE